jgi:hypothetical protein
LTKRELVAKGADGRYSVAEPFLAEWIVSHIDELA